MSDHIVRALLPAHDLLVVACVATDTAREARRRHGLAPSSAAMLGESLAAGLLLAALQKGEGKRVNLQVQCDGPAQSLFVDASPAGDVRGYIRGKSVRFPPTPRFSSGSMLGRSGYLAVLRELDGEFYRGQVGLEEGSLTNALEHYFEQSEQTATTLQLEVFGDGSEELGWVGGMLVQRLPKGDEAKLEELRGVLRNGFIERAFSEGRVSAHQLVEALAGEGTELLADHAASFACPCSRERVLRALGTLQNIDVVEMIAEDHGAEVDCDFCGAKYSISEDELRAVLEEIDKRDEGAKA